MLENADFLSGKKFAFHEKRRSTLISAPSRVIRAFYLCVYVCVRVYVFTGPYQTGPSCICGVRFVEGKADTGQKAFVPDHGSRVYALAAPGRSLCSISQTPLQIRPYL